MAYDRVVDTFVHTRLQAQPQVWIRDGWHAKFGMDPDPDNRGVGWTATQVAQWVPPAKDVQVGYYEAIKQATCAYLATLRDTDLEVRRVIPPVPEPRTVAAALGQMTWDTWRTVVKSRTCVVCSGHGLVRPLVPSLLALQARVLAGVRGQGSLTHPGQLSTALTVSRRDRDVGQRRILSAPCQCFSPALICTTSPTVISRSSCSVATIPLPAVTTRIWSQV